ncbi:MAG: tRNA (adenosine(37)-N6)-threonylcarbamoyltransferase complex dimerization subunit type 1 TsaB [Alphaproteobacteria bacterium]|nr:tRNA (adenosine(37)-N6)-threonylcarbamoyltransferase complex dimerization subunit type 1 TsaB [Rickettsiales bacterium]
MFLLISSSNTEFIGCALMRDNKLVDAITIQNCQNTMEIFPQNIKDILKRNQLNIKDIKTIFLDIGPGSFTGIRSGVSYVAGLTALGNIKVKTISGFDIMSSNFAYDMCEQNKEFHTDKLINCKTDDFSKYCNQSIIEKIPTKQQEINKKIELSLMLIPRSKNKVYVQFVEKSNGKIIHQQTSDNNLQIFSNKNNIVYSQTKALSAKLHSPQNTALNNKLEPNRLCQSIKINNFFTPISVMSLAKTVTILQNQTIKTLLTPPNQIFQKGLVTQKGIIKPFYLKQPNGTDIEDEKY